MNNEIIPKGWKKIKLKEVLTEISERNKGERVTVVLSVTNSQGFVKQEEYFEGTVHSENISNYKIIRKNQFAYNPSRVNVGSIDILKDYEEGALSPMYIVFEVDTTKLLPDYFKYYFQTNRFFENVKNNTQGSVRNSLSFKALSDFDYLLPPIEEQEKIVEILKTIDSIIEKHESLLEEKNQFIKSLFVEMFGDPIENPKNYKIVKLSDIADYWNGLTYKPTDVNKKGTIVLRSSNIQNSQLNYQDIVRVNCNIKEKQYVKDNDILMCSRNGSTRLVGKVAVIKDIKEKMTFGAFMMIIRSEYYPYLFSYFQTDAFRNQIKYGATTTINQITGNMLNKIKLPLPDKDDINQFAEIVKQIDKQKVESEKLITNYKTLKKGLMQQLLTGKVRVKI